MKYAICMLVHNKPALVERIVNRVMCDNTDIYIHLDAKCSITEYSHIKNVTFIPDRVPVHWGGRTMIIAMHNLIRYVVKNTSCEFIIFISGEDFPIVKPDIYHRYIDISKNYIEFEELPKRGWYMGGIDRIKYYYIFNSSQSVKSRIAINIQKKLNITRKYPKCNFTIFGGSQWININRTAAEYILLHWQSYYKFFKYCNISDELIFQTILLNSPLKDTVINTNYRFLKYNSNEPNPVYLDEDNVNDIMSSRTLFCRKIANINIFDRFDCTM